MTIQTTFANGNNPFQGLGALPSTQPKTIMQKPAKPSKQKPRLKDEDYATDYKPPVTVPELATQPELATKIRYVDTGVLSICNDPLPTGRSMSKGKYDDIFQALKVGQAVKCQSPTVSLIQGALRKFIRVHGMQSVVVRTCKDYGDGFGRVWMLAEPGKAGKVAT